VTTIAITPRGPFSLAASGRFLEGFVPTRERRLHAAMADAYLLDNPNSGQLGELSARWAPYRSWVALLLRTHCEETTHEIARGRTATRPA
jgi:hypothetical protein